MLTLPNKAEYKEKKIVLDDLLDNYKEYLEIVSEFNTNDTLRDIHNDVISEMCGKRTYSKESLYVVSIRRLIEMNISMQETLKNDTNKTLVDEYKRKYEETLKELEELKSKMKDILNVISRGE